MLHKIRNKSIHLITLKSGVINSYETIQADITDAEKEKYRDIIELDGADVPKQNLQLKAKIKEGIATNILNKYTINDYTERATKTVLNSIEEDKNRFTNEDVDLFLQYEKGHKSREKVLDALDKIKQERGAN